MEPSDRLTLDELIAWLVDLRKSAEDGRLPIVLEPDSWTIHDYVEIEDIEREPDRFMIKWGH